MYIYTMYIYIQGVYIILAVYTLMVLCLCFLQTFEQQAKEIRNSTEAKHWEHIYMYASPKMMLDEEPKDL